MAKVIFLSTPYENLGIEYLASVLKAAGHQVGIVIDPCLFLNPYQKNRLLGRLFDYTDYISGKIEALKPDLVCFSVMTDTYQWGIKLAGIVKMKTGAQVVFGGVHPSIVPDVVINDRNVDYVCIGEGEEALLELANGIHGSADCTQIPNIWSKRSGKVIKNFPRPLIADLDQLPFPDKEIYYRESTLYSMEYFLMAGRGCKYSCAFCCNHIFLNMYGGSYARARSVENVIKELSAGKKKYGFRFVWFMDDNFVGNINWLEEFSREYKRHIDTPFFCYAHPGDLTSEKADLLKDAGCHEVAMGVETLNSDTCKYINRAGSRISIQEALRVLKRKKIISVTENIMGLPYEKESDVLNLIGFYNSDRPDLILFSWLKIFPGTRLSGYLKENNLIDDAKYKEIIIGRDNSLARGGNYADKKIYNKAASLLVILPFLPKAIVRFLLKNKLYRCCITDPSFLLLLLRVFKTTRPAALFTGSRTYDAGAKISMRVYRYFILKRLLHCYKSFLHLSCPRKRASRRMDSRFRGNDIDLDI